MSKLDLISVIIPVYNVKEYMDFCIESVVNQTYQNLEIILVDDGSTDGSFEKCDAWKAKDDRIRVIHKKNGGLSDARNAAMEVMTGTYVSFVDGDDWVKPFMYEHLMDAVLRDQTKLACFRYEKCYSIPGKEQPEMRKAVPSVVLSMDEVMKNYITEADEPAVYHSAWSKLYHVDLVKKLRFEVGRKSEDIVFAAQVFEQVDCVSYISEELYCYNVIREGSIMNVKNEEHTFLHEIPNWKKQFLIFEESKCLAKWANLARFYFYWRMISYEKAYREKKECATQAKKMQQFLRTERKSMKKVLNVPYANRKKALRMRLYCVSPSLYWLADRFLEKR